MKKELQLTAPRRTSQKHCALKLLQHFLMHIELKDLPQYVQHYLPSAKWNQ